MTEHPTDHDIPYYRRFLPEPRNQNAIIKPFLKIVDIFHTQTFIGAKREFSRRPSVRPRFCERALAELTMKMKIKVVTLYEITLRIHFWDDQK